MSYQPLPNPVQVIQTSGPTSANPDPALQQMVVLLTQILGAMRTLNLMYAQDSTSALEAETDIIASTDQP